MEKEKQADKQWMEMCDLTEDQQKLFLTDPKAQSPEQLYRRAQIFQEKINNFRAQGPADIKRRQQIRMKTQYNIAHQAKLNRAQSWKEIAQLHRIYTPWLDDTQMNQVMKIYHLEAKVFQQRNILPVDKKWMLVFD